MDKEYFFIEQGSFVLGGHNSLGMSNSIFELNFFDLANNHVLLGLLKLNYIAGNYGVSLTRKEHGSYFAKYISSFSKKHEAMNAYLKTNPRVKILIKDNSILDELKKISFR